MLIITSKSKSRRFKPHYNSAMGQYVHTKDDYLGNMKRMGLEPYTGEQRQAPRKKYTPSKECREVVNAIKDRSDKSGNVTLNAPIVDFMNKKGKFKNRDTSNLNTAKGGWE